MNYNISNFDKSNELKCRIILKSSRPDEQTQDIE